MYREIVLMALLAVLGDAAPMNDKSIAPSHMLHATTSAHVQRHSIPAPLSKHDLYKQAHDQVVQTANVQEQSRWPDGIRPNYNSHAASSEAAQSSGEHHSSEDDHREKTIQSNAEKFLIRKAKTRLLGLQTMSAMPMFTHKLSVDKIKTHPEFDKWHSYRQELQKGRIQSYQLLPQFQSLRGQYQILAKNDNARERTEEQERNKIHLDTRRAKLNELKLNRDSNIPTFAQRLSLQELKDHPFMTEWHQNREMIEQGIMEEDNLPLHLSNASGDLMFNKIKRKEKKNKSLEMQMAKEYRDRMVSQNRSDKLQELKLHRSSAMPIFAQRLSLEEIKSHKTTKDWHKYRRLWENKEIMEKQLPLQFQPRKGRLRSINTGLKRQRQANAQYASSRSIDKKNKRQSDDDKGKSLSSKANDLHGDSSVLRNQSDNHAHNSDGDQELWDILNSQLDWSSK